MKLITALAAIAVSASATLTSAAADPDRAIQSPVAPSEYELSESDRELFVNYLVCSEMSAIRVLSEAEAAPCVLLYTKVKLTFVPNVDLMTFLEMPIPQRNHVNLEAYAGFVEWRTSQPDLFADLAAIARARIAEQGS